uniref:Uncharacterized protein n=1 Tax=viral metagenome TaxID=1070528 RepID=A0A6C0AG80_9ZZZZ
MLIKFKEIPEWLHKSQLYRDFDEDSEEEIEVKYLKDNEEINNFADFKNILKVSSFWALDKIPYTVYVYAYYNKEEVENYLKTKIDNIFLDKYKEMEDDFYTEITLNSLRLKMTNFLKFNNLPSKEIQKIKSVTKLRDAFDKLLRSKSDSFYLNLSEEIEKNKKLVYNINEFVNFYKNHEDYYNAKEFLKEYKNTPRYNIKTEFYEEDGIRIARRVEGNSMYKIIIKLFDIEIFVIKDHFHNDYKQVKTINNNQNIYFGVKNSFIIKFYEEKIKILCDYSEFSVYCTLKLNIFNKKEIFDQIENLKLYKTTFFK